MTSSVFAVCKVMVVTVTQTLSLQTDFGCYGNDSVSCLTVTIFIRCHSNNNKAMDTVNNTKIW